MPTTISGAELGLANIRTQGTQGQSLQGQGNVGLYVNTTTGNLVLQQQDQVLVGQGANTGLIRTYNSLGRYTDDNGDNFRFAFNQRLLDLSGTLNSAGSRITRIGGDGSESTFLYDASLGLYVSDEGAGAHDTLSYNASTQEWTYTEGSSQQQEIYDWLSSTDGGEGRLIRRLDTDGNTSTYAYNANGFIDEVTDASGQTMSIIYEGNNATRVTTVSGGVTQTLVRYSYDAQNRLSDVIVDLSPDDSSITDGNAYTTTYTYDGASQRVASVTQSDGTTTAFTYDAQDRIETVTDGTNNVITYAYTGGDSGGGVSTTTDYSLNRAGLTVVSGSEDYYPVPSGATWSDVAQALYGTDAVADRLRTDLGDPSLSGLAITLSSLPASYDVDTTTPGTSTDYDLDANAFVDTAPGSITRTLEPSALDGGGSGALVWNAHSGLTVGSDGTLTKTGAYGWANGNFISQQSLSAGADGWVEFTLSADMVDDTSLGFGAESGLEATHRFWLEGGYITVYEQYSWIDVGSFPSYQAGDVLRIERQNGVVTYSHNGNLLYTSSQASTGEVRATGFIAEQNGHSGEIAASFAPATGGESYYEVQSGDTWSSIASTLYGDAGVVDELQAVLGISTLTVGDQLTGLPSELIDDDAVVSVPPYYAVPAGAGWSDVTQALYGTTDADALSQLQNALSALGYTLAADEQILQSDVPVVLSVAESGSTSTVTYALQGDVLVTPPSEDYYPVPSGATWSDVAQALYGTDAVADRLRTDLGDPSLSGLAITLSSLPASYDVDTTTPGTSTDYDLDANAFVDTAPGSITRTLEPSALDGGGSGALVWNAHSGLTVGGDGTLTKTGAYGWANGNFISQQSLSAGADGWVEFTLSADMVDDTSMGFGAESGLEATHRFWLEGGYITVYEQYSWIDVGSFPSYQAGDVLRIERQNGVVTYSHNGNLLYTSSQASTGEVRATGFIAEQNGHSGEIAASFAPATGGESYYEVQSGDTWSSIASTLYGDAGVVDELQAVLGISTLTVGDQLTGLPSELIDDDAVVSVPPYYAVPAGAGWSDVTQALYGTTDADALSQLQNALSALGYTLAADEQILQSDVPVVLSVAESGSTITTTYNLQSGALTTPPVSASYYDVQAGNTWETIAQNMYGTITAEETAAVASELVASLGASYDLSDPANDIPESAFSAIVSITSGEAGDPIASETTVTDALGYQTTYRFDAEGRVLEMLSPTVNGARILTEYAYDADDNLISMIDGNGNLTRYEYDNRGNRILEQDAMGNTVSRIYTTANQLESETRYLNRDGNVSNDINEASGAQTSHFVYDDEQHLRFSVSAGGQVSEYRYSTEGNLQASINYTANDYTGSSFTEAALTTWAASQDQTQLQRTDTAYDFRGQIDTVTTYTATDTNGEGVINGDESVTDFVYDQNGRLLETIAPKGVATVGDTTDFITTYTYDGLGRLLSSTDALNRVTTTQYNDAAQTMQTQAANGLVTTTLFDDNGRLLSQSQTDPSATPLGTSTFVYDANGNLLTTRDPLNRETHTFYDGLNRAIASVDAEGSLSTVQYDNNSHAVQTTAYATTLSQAQINDLLAAATSSTLDLDASLSALTSSTGSIANAEDRTAYSLYNDANQLVYQISRFRNEASAVVGALTQFFYDGAGQLTDTIQYATAIPVSTLTASSTAADITPPASNALEDRHSRVFYTADGQIQGSLDAEGHLTENTYDGAGQLLTTVAYANPTAENLRASGDFTVLKNSLTVDVQNDQHTRVFYNSKGQVIATLDAEGYLSESTYDANGNVTESVRYATRATSTPANNTSSLNDLRPAPASNDQVIVNNYSQLDQLASVSQRANTTVLTTTAYGYDEVGQLTATITAIATDQARTTRARYDVQGRLIGELNGEGSAALDVLSNPTQAQIDALWTDHGVSHTYDQAGRRTSTTDANGNTTYFYYNDRNQLTHTVNASGDVRETTYNAFGEVSYTRAYTNPISTAGLRGGEITDGVQGRLDSSRDNNTDNTTQTNYTLRGAIRQMIDGENATTSYQYNTFSELQRQTQAISTGRSTVTEFEYTRRGQLEQTTDDVGGANRTTAQDYDAFGRVEIATDGNQINSQFIYDRLGRVVQTRQAHGTATAIQANQTYDAFGRVLTQTDGNRHTSTYTYDDANRSVTITTPEGISTTTTRNRQGETVRIEDGNGNVMTYGYDRNGNLTRTTQAEGTADEVTTTSEFDHANLMTQTEDARGVITTFDYDAANRLITRTVDAVDGGLNIQNQYRYDGQGRTIYSVDANGIVTQTQYDRRGQVSATIVDPTSYPSEFTRPSDLGPALNIRTEYAYDGRGKTLTMIEAAGTPEAKTTSYQYDNLGRRTQMVEDATTGGLNITTAYAYDDNDNLIRKTDAEGTTEARTTRYAYDQHNRLTFMADGEGQVTQSVYDDNGNVIRSTRFDDTLTTGQIADIDGGILTIDAAITRQALLDRTTRSVYDHDNRLSHGIDALNHVTQYTYDDNGNLTRTIERNDPLAADQLTRLDNGESFTVTPSGHDRVSYGVYDHLNRQAYSVNGEGYVAENRYDANGNRSTMVAYADALTTAQLNSLAAGTLNIASVYSNSSPQQTTHYVYDTQNRQRFIVNSLNYVSETRYDALGNTVRSIQYDNAITLPSLITEATIASAVGSHATDPDNRVILYQHDALGRVTQETDAENHTKQLSYDSRGNLTSVTDGNGNTGYFYYRGDDQIAFKIDPEGYITQYTHNAFGELRDEVHYGNRLTQSYSTATTLSTLDSWTGTPQLGVNQDQRTSYTYTDNGQVDTITYHSTTGVGTVTERNQYNSFGDLEFYTDKNNHTWTYQYNQLGQMTRELSPPVEVVTAVTNSGHTLSTERLVTEYDYDAFGNQTHKREAMGLPQQRLTVTHYDDLNRIERIESPSLMVFNPVTGTSSLQTPTLVREYDAFDNLIQETDANNNDQFYYYDNANRLVATVNADEVLQEFGYDAVGNLTLERTYDTRLTGSINATTQPTPVAGDTFRELTYTFDGNNRTTAIIAPAATHFSAALAIDNNNAYFTAEVINRIEYDGNGNVIRTTNPRGYSIHHYYNDVGNNVVSVDQLGYVTARAFDHAGNMIRESRYATALSTATFNDLTVNSNPQALINQVASSSAQYVDDNRIKEYDYNAHGRVVAERVLDVQHYSVDENNGELQTHNGAVETRYTHDGNGNITEIDRPVDGVNYYRYDALGRQDQISSPEVTTYVNATTDYTYRQRITTFYDALGNVAVELEHARSNNDDRITRSVFNSAGIQVAEIDPNGHRVDYDLNTVGNMLRSRETVTDVDGQSHIYHTYYEYDDLNREVSHYQIENPGATGEVDHTSTDQRYNTHGEIEAKGRNNQFQEYYEYDHLGRVFKTNEGNGTPRLYLYDANGNAVAEVSSIDTDLSNIRSAMDVSSLDPNLVQMTLSLYDQRDQLTDIFDAPMEFTGLTTSLTPENETVLSSIDPDPIVGAVENVGGLETDNTTLSYTTNQVVQFLPPEPSRTEVHLQAADHTSINLNNTTYVENGFTVNRTVEVLSNGNIRELFETVRPGAANTYLTRITEVKQIDEVNVEPLGNSDIAPGTLQFHGGENVEVTNTVRSYSDELLDIYEMTTDISVPYIEGYGDGNTRVVVLENDRTFFEREFTEDRFNISLDWSLIINGHIPPGLNRIQLYKGSVLIQDLDLNWPSRTPPEGAMSIATPKIISISAEHPSVESVRIRVNNGSWEDITFEIRSFQDVGAEFIAQGLDLNANNGDIYEYEAYDANGERINWVRGALGSSVSENAQIVTTNTRIEQTVYEVQADVSPGEVGVTETEQSAWETTDNISAGSYPNTGSTITYSTPNIQLGTFTEPTQRTNFPDQTAIDGNTTTTTRRWQDETVQRIVTAAPTLSDPHRIQEVITTTTEITTEVEVAVTGQQDYIDDEIFAVQENTLNETNITTTTETQVETVERFHQIVATNTIDNVSHNQGIAQAYPGGAFFSENDTFSFSRSVYDNGFTWEWSYEVDYPNVAGFPGEWSYTRSNSEYDTSYQRYDNISLYKGGVLIAQGQIDFGSGLNGTGRLTIPRIFGINDVYPEAVRAEVSLESGTWQSLDEQFFFNGESVFLGRNIDAVGRDYEVRVYDASNNILQWYQGSVDGIQSYSAGQVRLQNFIIPRDQYDDLSDDHISVNATYVGEVDENSPLTLNVYDTRNRLLSTRVITSPNATISLGVSEPTYSRPSYTIRVEKAGQLIATATHNTRYVSSSTINLSATLDLSDVSADATSARIRFNGGSWQTATAVNDASSRRFVFATSVADGTPYEYQLLNSSNVVLKIRTGIVGQPAVTQIYSYDENYTRIHRITSDSDFAHYQQVTTDSSRDQTNYIRTLLYSIASGETQDNIIHRSQSHNAFGEVITETDGRQNTTDLVYDKLGNAIRKISPETDIWTEQAVRDNAAVRARPTDHYYYNAQSELVGTQDANSDLISSGQITEAGFYNTRVLTNGRVETEFFADGSIKRHRYDRLGNLQETRNQIDEKTEYEYDQKGQLIRTERYDRVNNVDVFHSHDNFTYDARGNRISHTNALNNTETYRYDAEGRVINHTSFQGRQTNYRYNYIASLTNGVLGNEQAVGGFEKITENARGIATANNATDHTLVDRNTVFDRIVYHRDLGGHDFNYFYNHAGWLQQQRGDTSNSAGREDQYINYAYYNNGYLKEVSDVANDRFSRFQYDENGNRVFEYYGEVPFNTGQQTVIPYQVLSAEYDELNRVTRAFEQDRYDITYEYDAVGNRRHVRSVFDDLLRDQHAVQDFYYRYDEMNRFVVTLGQRDAAGNITHGNTGYTISYNALGQRVNATSELLDTNGNAHYSHERYAYDPNGGLTTFHLDTTEDNSTGLVLRSSRDNDALGQMQNYREFNADGTVTLHNYFEYDRDGLTTLSQDLTAIELSGNTRYTYHEDGTLRESSSRTIVLIDLDERAGVFREVRPGEELLGYTNTLRIDLHYANGTLAYASGYTFTDAEIASLPDLYRVDRTNYSDITNTYAYEGWDTYKQSTNTISGSARGVESWEPGVSTFTYDSNGHTRRLYDHEERRSYDYITNHIGQIMKRYQIDESDLTLEEPIIRRFFYLNGTSIGDVGTDEIDSRIDYAQILADRKLQKDRGGEAGPAHTDIKEGVRVVTSADFDQNYQAIGPDYPDHTPGSYIVGEGDSLQSIAARAFGDASLWYLIADANGLNENSPLTEGMRLTLPNTVTNIHNNADTFRPYDPSLTLGDTSPALPEPVAKDNCSSFKQLVVIIIIIVVAYYTGGAATTALGGTGSTTAVVVGGAIGGAAGSLAGQLAANAFGLQDGIDWKAVAIAAIAGAVAGGLQASGVINTGSAFLNGAIKGIVSNTVGQGVNIGLNRQDEFDWKGVAVAGIAGGINGAIDGGSSSTQTNAPIQAGDYGGFSWEAAAAGFGNGLRQGLVSDVVERIVRGKEEYKERGGFDGVGLIGNAIGSALTSGIHASAQGRANERANLDLIANSSNRRQYENRINAPAGAQLDVLSPEEAAFYGGGVTDEEYETYRKSLEADIAANPLKPGILDEFEVREAGFKQPSTERTSKRMLDDKVAAPDEVFLGDFGDFGGTNPYGNGYNPDGGKAFAQNILSIDFVQPGFPITIGRNERLGLEGFTFNFPETNFVFDFGIVKLDNTGDGFFERSAFYYSRETSNMYGLDVGVNTGFTLGPAKTFFGNTTEVNVGGIFDFSTRVKPVSSDTVLNVGNPSYESDSTFFERIGDSFSAVNYTVEIGLGGGYHAGEVKTKVLFEWRNIPDNGFAERYLLDYPF